MSTREYRYTRESGSDRRECCKCHHRISGFRLACGFTLIEVLVALSISLIGVLGGIVIYRTAHQTLDVTQAAIENQQGVRKGLEMMAQEVQETGIDTIDLSASGAISFASARNAGVFSTNADGSPDWQNAVVYFLDTQSHTLFRYVSAKTDWTTNFNTAAFLANLAQEGDEGIPLESLVSDATYLEFLLTNNLLEMTLAISRHVRSSEMSVSPETKLTTQIYIRN